MLGGVDDQYIGIGPLLAQHHNDGGNASAEEDIGRETNDRINIVFLNQVAADLTLLAAPKQYAMGQNDGHDTVGLEMIEIMKQKGIIGLAFGGHAVIGVARVVLFVLGWLPMLGIGRI